MKNHHETTVFLWLSYGFPMSIPRFNLEAVNFSNCRRVTPAITKKEIWSGERFMLNWAVRTAVRHRGSPWIPRCVRCADSFWDLWWGNNPLAPKVCWWTYLMYLFFVDDQLDRWYPLVNVYIEVWKGPAFFIGNITISMAMFNSYVKLPEGRW